jgi:hypothetical protein
MKRFILLALVPMCLFAQLQMKRIAFLDYGLRGTFDGRIVCGDINNDGYNELIFGIHNDIRPNLPRQCQFWQCQPMNRYQLVYVDTGWPRPGPPPLGIKTGNLCPFAGGFLDQDSCFDLIGPNEENFSPDTVSRLLTTVQEGPLPSSYPVNLVWFDRLGVQYDVYSHYITDLDQDGRKEIFMNWSGPRIYENTGNNQYTLVFSCPHGTAGAWRDYAFGDFDQDGRMEIAYPADSDRVVIRKCTGDNQYPIVASLPFPIVGGNPLSNPHNCWSGYDIDGRPLFFVAFANPMTGTFYLYKWRATGINTYERTFIDQITTYQDGNGVSKCGDIDGDGIDEIVWSVGARVLVYKATGNNQFQRVWNWRNDHGGSDAIVNVYDMNKNGYNEIIIGGGGYTSIYEVEAVMVLSPNGGEILHPDSSETIHWQTFNPPRCDSLSLFYSIDNGRTYQSIVHGLQSTDTSYVWTVPNVNSDSCKIKIIAYGPGWQYDESDGVFSITTTGIEERSSLFAKSISKSSENADRCPLFATRQNQSITSTL